MFDNWANDPWHAFLFATGAGTGATIAFTAINVYNDYRSSNPPAAADANPVKLSRKQKWQRKQQGTEGASAHD
eukprot:g53402.t1